MEIQYSVKSDSPGSSDGFDTYELSKLLSKASSLPSVSGCNSSVSLRINWVEESKVIGSNAQPRKYI